MLRNNGVVQVTVSNDSLVQQRGCVTGLGWGSPLHTVVTYICIQGVSYQSKKLK
jgi:hypothetical protein